MLQFQRVFGVHLTTLLCPMFASNHLTMRYRSCVWKLYVKTTWGFLHPFEMISWLRVCNIQMMALRARESAQASHQAEVTKGREHRAKCIQHHIRFGC